MQSPKAIRLAQVLIACLLLFLAAPIPPSVAARPAANAAAAPGRAAVPSTSGLVAAAPAAAAPAPTLGPAVTGLAGVPDGAHELLAARSRSGRTYVNPNGTRTLRTTMGPQNYQDSTGAWQPINDALIADGAGGFTNTADAYTVHLPASLAAGPVRVSEGTAAVAYALVGAGAAPAAVKGATATYTNVLPGVSAAYTASGGGVEEDLTLASAAAPRTFTYTLTTTSLTAKANTRGGVDFVDQSGAVPFTFAPPALVDAAHARSRAATLTLGQGTTGQTVTVTADASWLANPARQYPVTLDPVLVVTVGATQDCLIDSAYPTTNECANSYDAVGASGSEVARTLLSFGVQPAADVTILGAEVGLYQFGATNTTAETLELHQVTRAWTQGATWDTADGVAAWSTPGGDFTATPAATANDPGTAANGSWLKFTPGALVAGWANGSVADDGFLLKAASESTTQAFDFCPGLGRGAGIGCTSALAPYLAVVLSADLGAAPSSPSTRRASATAWAWP